MRMAGRALSPSLAASALALAVAFPVSAQAPTFASGEPLSSDTGQVLVEWNSDRPVTLGIADAANAGVVRELYSGENSSYFLSGLADGNYVLVLGDDEIAEADTIAVNVTQQSLTQAIWLTVIGAIITLGILITILRGARP